MQMTARTASGNLRLIEKVIVYLPAGDLGVKRVGMKAFWQKSKS